MKVRNQLLNNSELGSPRAAKKNTMGLGVFRSDKITEAVGRAPSPSYLERSQQMHGRGHKNLHEMTSNAEYNIAQNQLVLESQKRFKEHMRQLIRQEDQMVVFDSTSPRF